MDLEIVDGSLKFYKKRKKWVIWLVLADLSGYGAYRVYNFHAVSRKRRKLMRLIGALVSMAVAVSDSAETIRVVSKDLKEFLISDGDEILIQENQDNTSKECTRGLVSAVVGSFAKNLVLGFYYGCSTVSGGCRNGATVYPQDGFDSSIDRWVSFECNDKSQELIAYCIRKVVGTAVTVYLDKTRNINFYDELFTGLTNPNHEVQIREMLVLLCNGAIETLVKDISSSVDKSRLEYPNGRQSCTREQVLRARSIKTT